MFHSASRIWIWLVCCISDLSLFCARRPGYTISQKFKDLFPCCNEPVLRIGCRNIDHRCFAPSFTNGIQCSVYLHLFVWLCNYIQIVRLYAVRYLYCSYRWVYTVTSYLWSLSLNVSLLHTEKPQTHNGLKKVMPRKNIHLVIIKIWKSIKHLHFVSFLMPLFSFLKFS